jgi:3-oxoacyl-[acyl-carrier-protein] synthase II
MAKRRVVITGLGMISPLGNDTKSSWQACVDGQSGVEHMPEFEAAGIPSQVIGKLKNFDPTELIARKDLRRYDKFSQVGMIAAEEAIHDAGFLSSMDPHRVGVAVGSGIGGIHTITAVHEKFLAGGYKKVSPFFIPASIVNMLPGHISIRHGLKGPNISIVTACTSGTHNIGQAYRMIQYGDADIMVAGGAETACVGLCESAFAAAKALSTKYNDQPSRASRPWDKNRDGFVNAEGAGILVLEDYDHAKQRQAPIYAEVIGFGMSADAYHMTQPSGKGGVYAMKNALADAKLNAEAINYINAHATSTLLGDVTEIQAIKQVFGAHAYRVAVSSTKSMTGHLLGAAGAVEAIFSILASRENIAPPTINLDDPDEGCDLNLVPHTAQSCSIQYALSNSFGFGGTNASLIFAPM